MVIPCFWFLTEKKAKPNNTNTMSMKVSLRKLLPLLLCLVGLCGRIVAEEATDDGAAAYQNDYNDGRGYSAGDDYIKYWTDYAILPKRCIV